MNRAVEHAIAMHRRVERRRMVAFLCLAVVLGGLLVLDIATGPALIRIEDVIAVLQERLEAILRRIVGRAAARAEHEEAAIDVVALAAVRATREALRGFNAVRLFGPDDAAGIVSFAIEGVHPHDLGTILDEEGVAIRAGHHCAQPLMQHLGVPATARASFGIYSDESDVAALVRGIERTLRIFG